MCQWFKSTFRQFIKLMNIGSKNMLLSLKNSSCSKIEFTYVNYSKKNLLILELLYSQGIIQSYKLDKKISKIYVVLRYYQNKSVLQYLKIFSNFSQHLTLKELSRFFNKKFVLFLSTNKGLLTSLNCKKYHVSGKLLFLC